MPVKVALRIAYRKQDCTIKSDIHRSRVVSSEPFESKQAERSEDPVQTRVPIGQPSRIKCWIRKDPADIPVFRRMLERVNQVH